MFPYINIQQLYTLWSSKWVRRKKKRRSNGEEENIYIICASCDCHMRY